MQVLKLSLQYANHYTDVSLYHTILHQGIKTTHHGVLFCSLKYTTSETQLKHNKSITLLTMY